jgi:hypothetical protein
MQQSEFGSVSQKIVDKDFQKNWVRYEFALFLHSQNQLLSINIDPG